jgi:hypothetical protein
MLVNHFAFMKKNMLLFMKKHISAFGFALIAFVFVLGLFGCNKDNPTSSNLTNAEMLQGNWKIVSYTIGGIDQLYTEENNFIQCLSGAIIPFTNTYTINPYYWNFSANQIWNSQFHSIDHTIDMSNSISNCLVTYVNVENDVNESGTWEFNANETQIKIMINGIQDKWNIGSLTNSAMHLTLDGGTSHQIHLEKQ